MLKRTKSCQGKGLVNDGLNGRSTDIKQQWHNAVDLNRAHKQWARDGRRWIDVPRPFSGNGASCFGTAIGLLVDRTLRIGRVHIGSVAETKPFVSFPSPSARALVRRIVNHWRGWDLLRTHHPLRVAVRDRRVRRYVGNRASRTGWAGFPCEFDFGKRARANRHRRPFHTLWPLVEGFAVLGARRERTIIDELIRFFDRYEFFFWDERTPSCAHWFCAVP
jgi:hypothetical protein